jgi:hypothetical protein
VVVLAAQLRFDQIDRRLVPTRVNDSQFAEVEPQRKGAEPLDVEGPLFIGELLEKSGVLVLILLGVQAQKITGVLRILGGVGHGIELVITHHDLRRPRIDHCLDHLEDPELGRTPVDQIAHEYGLSVRVPVGTRRRGDAVTEFAE